MIIEHGADGRIVHIISDPIAEEVRAHYMAAGGIEAPRGCGLDTHYVKDGAVLPRPVSGVKVVVNGRTIRLAGVPAGSAVALEIEGSRYETDDLEIEVDEPGLVTIVVTPPWPMMEVRHDFEIE